MSMPKYQNNAKIALVTLILGLMLFIKPILADKTQSKGDKSGSDAKKAQTVQTPPAAAAPPRRAARAPHAHPQNAPGGKGPPGPAAQSRN